MTDDSNDEQSFEEKVEILKAAGFREADPALVIDPAEYDAPLRMVQTPPLKREFTPPPLRQDQSLFWTMAVRNGQMFAAPIGTLLDLNASEAWIRVDSTEQLRKLFGVQP